MATLGMGSPADFEALSSMLSAGSLEDADTRLPPKREMPSAGPGAIGAPGSLPGMAPIPKPKAIDDKAIWEEEEVVAEPLTVDASDSRVQPEYEIMYKQDVSTMDVFAGLDFEKDPGSHSCTEIIVKVTLPGDEYKNLDLDVQKDRLVVQSKKHILKCALPFPCDPKNGSAKWDASESMLSVTLPIIRRDD